MVLTLLSLLPTTLLAANDKRKLRNHVQLLRATGKIDIEGDVNKISASQLLAYVQDDKKDMRVCIEYLDHLRQGYFQCEVCKLRVQAIFLESRGFIALESPVQLMALEALKTLSVRYQDILRKFRSDVDQLAPAFHRCRTDCQNEHSRLPNPLHAKYKSPEDGTGTSQIPGLFSKGEVTPEDVEEHKMVYVDGNRIRTFFGLLNPPGSTDPQVVLFIDLPNVEDMSEISAQRLFRLAQLLHLGATYSPKCERNAAHQAINPALRKYSDLSLCSAFSCFHF